MEVKVWLKEQRIRSLVGRVKNEPFHIEEDTFCFTKFHKATTALYETDLSVAEGLTTFYKVAEKFLNENGFENIYGMTVIEDGVYFSFELGLEKHTEVINAVVKIEEDEK